MKYTTTVKETQVLKCGIKIEPSGGTVTESQARTVASDPWGKRLIDTGKLKFEKAVEVSTKPKLGMTVTGSIKPTNTAKTEVKK